MKALAVGGAKNSDEEDNEPGKPRSRAKFTTDQKEQMIAFAEKVGWRIQRHHEAEVQEFCANTGVKRDVLKAWIANNKHSIWGKKL